MIVEYKDIQNLTNYEIYELVEEYDLLDELIDILVENGDYTPDDDLSQHERAMEIARDLLESII